MLSINNWLDTFTCSKYAERFERSGYQNIQSVCQLTVPQLQNLGVAPNDISIIMENVLLLKQSLKSLEQCRYLDLNSEPPQSMSRSRTGSPSINTISRPLSQNPSAYSPGPHVSTPPASSGPSPDRNMGSGSSTFDPSVGYHRSNSYSTPVNPNTFLDISPTSSISSPHRSSSIDAYPTSIEPAPYNDYSNHLPAPMQPPPHSYPNPGMMYRANHPPPNAGGYYNAPSQPPPRFYSPDGQPPPQQQQQQHFMYPNQRMMMHPQQPHPSWSSQRPPMPHQNHSHQMTYHAYDQHQYRMPNPPPYHPANHSMMSDHNAMFMNSQQQQQQQQQSMNPSMPGKIPNSSEPHPHPLQSLERLVLLPESQVVDPKSVVNEIHDSQSPFSESLSPNATSSPKNSIATPPTATIVSNLLTNEKSVLDSHGKNTGGLKRSSLQDDRHDPNKKNRLNIGNDSNTGDSIINNHPVVTSLLTRGLNNTTAQSPLPSIKSLQQKHNPAFMQQNSTMMPTTQQLLPGMFGQSQPDSQQFLDGLMIQLKDDETLETEERDYEEILDRLRNTGMSSTHNIEQQQRLDFVQIPSQLDGLSETTNVTTKSSNGSSRKRRLSTTSDKMVCDDEHNSNESIKNNPSPSRDDDEEKKQANSTDHQRKSRKRQPSQSSNTDSNQSSEDDHLQASSSTTEKIKSVRSIKSSNPHRNSEASNESTLHPTTDNLLTSKPVREAKKRSLIYTGNTREFLETAIAAGLIDANGDEEDEDNEYVPPGGRTAVKITSAASSSSSNASENSDASGCENHDESTDDDSDNEEDDEDVDENEDQDDSEDESASSDESKINSHDDVDDDDEEEHDQASKQADVNDNENDQRHTKNGHDEPSESGINWNVRSRPRRETHSMRFNNISKEQEESFFEALQEQMPQLASYLNEDSDDEFLADKKEPSESTSTVVKKSSTKKSQHRQIKESTGPDDGTVEIIKKLRHVSVPSVQKSKRKSTPASSQAISSKSRPDELFVSFDEDVRRIISGAQSDGPNSKKKSSPIESFHFQHRPTKTNTVEDLKAPWRCILCWKEPYENYLGPLFGAYPLNEQCQSYLTTNKLLDKHYRKLKEVWFHRDCALWNNHIQMNPNTGDLMHVSDACSTYLEITCSMCQIPGAALACRYRNCKVRYHYPCAKTIVNCQLIVQSYSIYCPKHNQMNNSKSKKNSCRSITDSNKLTDTTIITENSL